MLGMMPMDLETYSFKSFANTLSIDRSFIPLSILEVVFKVIEVLGGERRVDNTALGISLIIRVNKATM